MFPPVCMIHIAFCGHIDIRGSIGTPYSIAQVCAEGYGFEDASIDCYESPFELIDVATNRKAPNKPDIIVCGTQLSGLSGIELIKDIRQENTTAGIVYCSDAESDAYEALTLKVDSYLVVPVSEDAFKAAMNESLRRVSAYHANSIVVKTREGSKRIKFSQFLYSKTVDHDQEIHLTDGSTFRVRLSSQAFFDQMKGDSRFFKAGSSYIVNVRMVRFVDSQSSTARMMDGTVISIPVRVRKPLEAAILANG